MAGNIGPPPPPAGSSPDSRDRRADERERRADERERHADERERRADQAEAIATERERQADSREEIADERESQADSRQSHADERERRADARQKRMNDQEMSVADRRRAGLEAIERARVLLSDSAERLDRRAAAMSRELASDDRDQSEIDRATARSAQEQAAQLPDPRGPVERAEVLRRHLLAAARSLSTAEEEVAQIHDELADRDPDRSGEYRRLADEAREKARRATEVSQLFTY